MARHLKPLVQRWSSRVFSVDMDGAPLYFRIREKLRGETAQPAVFNKLQKEDRCYSLLLCSGDRITGDRFHWELRDKLLRELPAGSDVTSMSSFLPDEKGSMLKGYFLKGRPDSSPLIEAILSKLEQSDPVLVCSYSQSDDGQQWAQCLWSPAEENLLRFYVVPSEVPEHHPSVLNMINCDVFYSLEEACDVLKKVCTGSVCTESFYTLHTSIEVHLAQGRTHVEAKSIAVLTEELSFISHISYWCFMLWWEETS